MSFLMKHFTCRAAMRTQWALSCNVSPWSSADSTCSYGSACSNDPGIHTHHDLRRVGKARSHFFWQAQFECKSFNCTLPQPPLTVDQVPREVSWMNQLMNSYCMAYVNLLLLSAICLQAFRTLRWEPFLVVQPTASKIVCIPASLHAFLCPPT